MRTMSESNISSTRKPTVADGRKSHEIIIESGEPLVIETGRRKPQPLTHEEARLITAQIRTTSLRLWLLVVEAHDRQAHIALGYDTWADYVGAELKMSESRSYQLIDTGHVMRELAVAGVDVEHVDPPPARVVARIKDRLPDVRKSAREAMRKGEDLDKSLRALAREPRPPSARGAPKAPAAEAPEPPAGEGAPAAEAEGLVKCPACKGSGQVAKGLAPLIRDLMRSVK